MTTFRNVGDSPVRLRRIARVGRTLGSAALTAAIATLTACADAPTGALAAAPDARAQADLLPLNSQSRVVSQTWKGDTVVTVFVLGTGAKEAKVGLGYGHKIEFPYAAASVCTLATSGYGAGTWDLPCLPSVLPVEVTAKAWFDASGLPRTDFQPAMRFVPGLPQAVELSLHDRANAPSAAASVLYCTEAGACVDEAKADPSLRTVVDPTNGFWVRKLKHFSGYNVVFGFDGGEMMLDRAASAPGPRLGKGGTAPGQGAGNGNGNGGSKPGDKATGTTPDSVWLGTELATPELATSLERRQALADTVSATFAVTKDGGTFTLPGTGLTIWVQANTVSAEFPLTVKALPGKVVAYQFGPHGTKFPKSLIMIQDLKGTNYNARTNATFEAGYFGSLGDLDATAGTALIKERLQSTFDAESGNFYFAVNHFSGYMVSWGRQSMY
jgi:hypothetical protein